MSLLIEKQDVVKADVIKARALLFRAKSDAYIAWHLLEKTAKTLGRLPMEEQCALSLDLANAELAHKHAQLAYNYISDCNEFKLFRK